MKGSPLTAALALAVAGCSANDDSRVDLIEIGGGEEPGYRIVVRRDGRGEIRSESGLERKFRLTASQFQRLESDLRSWKSDAQPVNDASIQHMMEWGNCRPGDLSVSDAGGMYLRWQGPELNVHQNIYFGCLAERNAVRYRRLEEAVDRLPIQSFLEEAGRPHR